MNVTGREQKINPFSQASVLIVIGAVFLLVLVVVLIYWLNTTYSLVTDKPVTFTATEVQTSQTPPSGGTLNFSGSGAVRSCPTALTCYAIEPNGNVGVSRDSGKTWQLTPAGFSQLVLAKGTGGISRSSWKLSCPDEQTCHAAFSSAKAPFTNYYAVSQNAARGWVVNSGMPDNNVYKINNLACLNALSCIGVTLMGLQITTNGGQTWINKNISNTSEFYDIACPTIATCLAVGGISDLSYLFVTTDGGKTWVHKAAGTTALASISCPDKISCEVKDGNGVVYRVLVDGTGWQEISN